MPRLLFLLALSGFVWGCGPKKPPIPMSEEKLVSVLLDAHTAEAALSYLYGAKRDTFADQYYAEIYSIHKITEEEFRQSIRALRNNPQYMLEVYTRLLAELDEKVPD